MKYNEAGQELWNWYWLAKTPAEFERHIKNEGTEADREYARRLYNKDYQERIAEQKKER